MRTDCLLLLPTLTFLTLLLAALFARDRLHEAFLDTVRGSTSFLLLHFARRLVTGFGRRTRGLSSIPRTPFLMYVYTYLPTRFAPQFVLIHPLWRRM